MSAMGPEGSGHWLLCLTFLFHKVGRRPLAFPDLGCDHVTLGMKVPEKGHARVITPFSVLERLCVVTCVLFMTYFSLPTPILFCIAFLFFQFSELSSITQSVGGLVIGLPEVAWPGLVHTGGPVVRVRRAQHPPSGAVCFPRGPHSWSPAWTSSLLPRPVHRIPLSGFLTCLLVLPTVSCHDWEHVL